MRLVSRAAVLVLLVLSGVQLHAALSKEHSEWAKGPVQWIMTRDEAKAWRNVKTDEEAQAFIDLFWARRDPTPGTYANEFRAEFDWRVETADQRYRFRNTPGSLTDRGRALVILGFPTNLNNEASKANPITAGDRSVGGQTQSQLGARDAWIWEHNDAMKYGMPRIEAVFIQDPISGMWQRDTQRGDIVAAYAAAIDRAIVNRDLTAVPEWAKKPPELKVELVPAKVAPVVPLAAVRPAGAHDLVLTKDISTLNPQSGKDPFAGLASVASFTKQDELGYAFEFCSDVAVPPVKVAVTISGMIKGEKINMKAPLDDATPEHIKALAGCHVIRGSIPVADMDAGDYTIDLLVQDGTTNQSYNLQQKFKVE